MLPSLDTEPTAFDLVNAQSESNLLLLCDHASNRVPANLNQLGLNAAQLDDHIAWDAGTAQLARSMASILGAPLILSNYSRLVIDCNRPADHEESIVEESHGVIIPGNHGLTQTQRHRRYTEYFQPYHDCLEKILDRLAPLTPSVVSIHSFSPMLNGKLRPWGIGVCYGRDRRLADLFLAELKLMVDSGIGDNQPYSIDDSVDFTLPHHAARRAIPHVMLELSRDHLRTDTGIARWAERLAIICRKIPGFVP